MAVQMYCLKCTLHLHLRGAFQMLENPPVKYNPAKVCVLLELTLSLVVWCYTPIINLATLPGWKAAILSLKLE